MELHSLAGKLAPAELLIDVSKVERDYYGRTPEPADPQFPEQIVNFGTSGHRGTPLDATFTETHILAITQAICDYRHAFGIDGPLYLAKDTHASSAAAHRTALEVLAANEVETFLQQNNDVTPTPAVSRAILVYNHGREDGFADGIIITPSHNPPQDGGIKYNPPNGGPADSDVTNWIQKRANQLLLNGNKDVRCIDFDAALKCSTTHAFDFIQPYVEDLIHVIDMDAIRASNVRIGVDPLGGASVNYWEPIKERYRLNLTVVNEKVDPTFRFVPVDHDGKIRMDCSSRYAMASLDARRNQFEVAFGCDPDADRHGIVTHNGGLMNPNFYLAVAIRYLLTHRHAWSRKAAVGKTIVSSGIIDRVVHQLDRTLTEVPVGFKWFADGLFDHSFCFGGEESAGASFLRRNGTVWTTDKDGLILGLLAAEIVARTGSGPWRQFEGITNELGKPYYDRSDTPCNPEQKARFKHLTPECVSASEMAGEPVTDKLVNAPGNNAPIGGLKVVTANGWFAARPSGTENLYKLYAESFKSKAHLDAIIGEARRIISRALSSG